LKIPRDQCFQDQPSNVTMNAPQSHGHTHRHATTRRNTTLVEAVVTLKEHASSELRSSRTADTKPAADRWIGRVAGRRKRSRHGASLMMNGSNGTGRWMASIISTVVGILWILRTLVFLRRESSSGLWLRNFNIEVSPIHRSTGQRNDERRNTSISNIVREVMDRGIVARAYEPWGDTALPCLPPDDPQHYSKPVSLPQVHQGFLFMKLMKTGGSTAAGVNIRILKQVARQQQLQTNTSVATNVHFQYCQGRFEHAWGYEMLAGSQDRARRFAWTVVRDPTQRAISQFFHFEVSRQNSGHSDFVFQKYLWSKKKRLSNYYLQVLNDEMTFVSEVNATFIVNKILSDYNFIGVTERMDESLVALMLILKVPMGAILYLAAKSSGGYDDGGTGTCVFIQPSHLSAGMKAFFDHPRWMEVVKWDNLLYKAVNRSLDLTIAKLGSSRFQENLSRFRRVLQVASNRCFPREVFPCTSTGQKNRNKSCLWKDSGCGSDCLDEVATELELW
jgi:Sulfotransferase family